jgi:chromosome partitioning protein
MPILLLINLKGGVAKTTNAVAIAECLAAHGYRTLLIDADHQCMASELALGENRLLRCDPIRTTLHDLLATMLDDEFNSEQIGQYVVGSASNIAGGLRTLSVIPCSVRIEDFSTNMAKAKRGYHSNEEFLRVLDRRRKQMQRWLSANADFTIIDCPPSLSLQVKVFLSVADGFIVPSVPDRLSVRGSLYLLNRIAKLGYSKIKPIGTLWSLYRQQNHVHRTIVNRSVRRVDPFDKLPVPFETVIPNATAIADSSDAEKHPASFRAKYTLPFAKLFERLCEEIVVRTQWQAAGERVATAQVAEAR